HAASVVHVLAGLLFCGCISRFCHGACLSTHGDRIALPMTHAPNKPDAPNPAITPRFHVGHHSRRVGDPGRSTNVLTAGMDWPRKGAKCAKEIQLIRSRPTSAGRIGPVPFAPLALFRRHPDFLVSTFRARRSSNQ